MRLFILSILGFLFCSKIFAQYENVSLLVQSPDGKTVKLVWFFKRWNSDITGFDIKRKDGIGDWVKLNREPIVPEISTTKNLSIVEADETEESAAKDKLFKLLASKKLEETDDSTLLHKLSTDNKAFQDLMKMLAGDYSLALITGFAYVDHTVTKKQDYQYGLFIKGTDVLLDSVLWNYGQIPDLNAVNEITSKANKKSKGVQLMWNADVNKMRAGDVAGFNVYREGIRLNSTPIMATNNNDISEFTWSDRSANNNIPNHYSISAESLFGIEGIIKPYTYNPADHPDTYEKPEVKEVTSLGYYFKEGINVKWDFPKESEHFLKGFYVEKDNMPGGYNQVSALLDPSTRVFTDKSPSPVTGYIRFRVVAVYNDKTKVKGIERVYNYFPMREPPLPENIKAKGVLKDKKFTVNISWDPPMNGDTSTDYYRIYLYNPSNNNLEPVTEKPIRTNNFNYLIGSGAAARYKFFISSIGKNKTESPLSDTIAVNAPSLEIPLPVINKILTDNNKAIVKWQYAEIADLKGFRLYQNKNVIATENELTKKIREFTTPVLAEGTSYDFTIVAVSENDIVSEVSLPVTITIPLSHKK